MPGHGGGRESPTHELEKALLAPEGTPEILQGTALSLPPRLLLTSGAVDSDITFRSFLEILTRQSSPLSFFFGRGGRHFRCSRVGSKHRPCHRQRADRPTNAASTGSFPRSVSPGGGCNVALPPSLASAARYRLGASLRAARNLQACKRRSGSRMPGCWGKE